MSELLYQLRSTTQRPVGSYFAVDGPYDVHGYVVKSELKQDDHGKPYYLNLVRGTGYRRE